MSGKVQGLNREFAKKDVERMRNLIQGKYGEKTQTSVGFTKSEKQYEEGDIWEPGWNLVISGHIHSRQWVGENVYYPGASIQQAFGESDRNIIPVITFEDGKYNIVEHDLRLPRKKIIYTELSKMEDLQLKDTEDQVKITLSGNYEEFKTFKKSKKYKEIISKGIKIVYKQKKIKTENLQITESSFDKILFELINQNSNKYLLSDYHHVFLNREKNCKI